MEFIYKNVAGREKILPPTFVLIMVNGKGVVEKLVDAVVRAFPRPRVIIIIRAEERAKTHSIFVLVSFVRPAGDYKISPTAKFLRDSFHYYLIG